jgi:hypothetical protein
LCHCGIFFRHITTHHIISHHTTPHYITAYYTTLHHTSDYITSYHTTHHTPHHTPHYITSYHITPQYITSYHTTHHTPHHIATTHHITSHHTTPHHITSHTLIDENVQIVFFQLGLFIQMSFLSHFPCSFLFYVLNLNLLLLGALNLREIGWGGMDWIDLAQDMDHLRALVKTVMNLRVP